MCSLVFPGFWKWTACKEEKKRLSVFFLDSKAKEGDKIVLQRVGFEISRERQGFQLQSRKMAERWQSFWKTHWNYRGSRFTSFLARGVSFLGREKAKRATKSREFQRRIKIGQWTFLEVYCSGREAPFCQGSVKLLADDVIWPVTILNDYFRWWSHRFWWRQLPRLLWCRMPLYFLMMISSFWSPELLWRQLYHLRHGVEPLIFFYSVFGWDPLALMFTNVPLSFIFNKIKKKSLCSLWVCFLLQKTSSYCQDSCEFLTKVKTLSSIITGDGSLPPTPRNLTVTNRSFTSISLQWEAVKNTNGSPVYLIEMQLSTGGGKYIPAYMEEVDWIKFFIILLWLKVIPLKLFYYQTFLETWHNQHSWYEH